MARNWNRKPGMEKKRRVESNLPKGSVQWRGQGRAHSNPSKAFVERKEESKVVVFSSDCRMRVLGCFRGFGHPIGQP